MTPPAPQAAAPARLPASEKPKATKLLAAASHLLPSLERGVPLDARLLREAMTAAFEGSDQDGAWLWKDAYEASEAAAVLFLRKYGPGILNKGFRPRSFHDRARFGASALAHAPLGGKRTVPAILDAAWPWLPHERLPRRLTPGELVLEPSAGTGLLAIHAEIAGAALALNELAETRHALLSALFPQAPVTRFNGEQIDDYLDGAIRPSTVLMNPPFSASPGIERTMRDATVRHIRSALRRLPDGGRLVVLTAAAHDPQMRRSRRFTPIFRIARISRSPRRPTAASMRGTARTSTRGSRSSTGFRSPPAQLLFRPDTRIVLRSFWRSLKRRCRRARRCSSLPAAPAIARTKRRFAAPRTRSLPLLRFRRRTHPAEEAEELSYEPREAATAETRFSDRLYEPYEVQAITIAGAKPHPTKLVQSAAMASVHAAASFLQAASAKAPCRGRRSFGRAARDDHLCRRSA